MNIKKIFVFLFLIFFVLLPAKSVFASVFEVDQSYKPSPAFGFYNINSSAPIAQTFKPSKNRLSSVHIVITTTSVGDYEFILFLKKADTTIASSSLVQTLNGSKQTLVFDFADLPSVSSDIEYSLYLETNDTGAKWYYGQADGVGGYSRGHSIINGISNSADFHFVTYGPIEESPAAEENQDSQEEDQNDNSKIDTPTNLELLDKSSEAIKISWDRVDDENLEGYKIYYGKSRKKLNEEIDVGINNTYTIRGLDPETFYYIAVTAYDENRDESAKSKILQVKTKTNQERIDPWDIVWYIARILSVVILIGAVVFWYWWKKKKDKKKADEKEKKINVNINKKQDKKDLNNSNEKLNIKNNQGKNG